MSIRLTPMSSKMLAADYGLKVGTVTDTKYKIPQRIEEGTLFDMLGNASDLTIINTGKVYVLYDDFGKLCLKPYESLLLPLYIDEDTAQGYSYTSSIDSDVYNRIKLAWDNDETGVREVHVMNNTASQSKWGTLQYYEKLDNALNTADLQTKAKALMKYYNVIHRELTMQKVFGDVRARAGTSVCVGMGLGDINIKKSICAWRKPSTRSAMACTRWICTRAEFEVSLVPDMFTAMKQIAENVFEARRPADWYYGKVISLSPFQVQIDQKTVLKKGNFLAVRTGVSASSFKVRGTSSFC